MSIATEISRLQSAKASIKSAIEAQGVTVSSSATLDDYPSLIAEISGGGGGGGTTEVEPKDVNFIDYDGTILHAYTKAEFLALSAFPSNPSHDGLTAQGWNWDFNEAQTFVQTNGAAFIGQLYTTNNGETRIYCSIGEGQKSIYLNVKMTGTITVDWGDESATETQTYSSSTYINLPHTYSNTGDYVIKFTIENGSGYSEWTPLVITPYSGSENALNYMASNTITKMEIGTNFKAGTGFFRYCNRAEEFVMCDDFFGNMNNGPFYNSISLKAIIVPKTYTSAAGDNFSIPMGCKYVATNNKTKGAKGALEKTAVRFIVETQNSSTHENWYAMYRAVIAEGITTLGNNCFRNCYSLNNVLLPSTLTALPAGCFRACYALANLSIPENVASIGDNAFYDCRNLKELHMKPSTPPTISGSNTFTNFSNTCVIYVPSGKLNDYQTASDWSSLASQMQEES